MPSTATFVCLALVAVAFLSSDSANAALDPLYTNSLSYTADAVITLPYSGTSEPVKVYYDLKNKRSRTEFYNGLDVYVYRADSTPYGYQFQINPVSTNEYLNKRRCFLTKGDKDDTIALQTIIPDLSSWKKDVTPQTQQGILCDVYTTNYTVGSKLNYYEFYVSKATGDPVYFKMLGHDDLLGSHYDTYDIIYYNVRRSAPTEESLYNPPGNMTCGDFPGPGLAAHNRNTLRIHEDHAASEEELETHFDSFKTQHSKMYGSDEEHSQRLFNFRHNKRYIESMNKQGLSFTLAINHLADLHDSEIRKMRGSYSSRNDYEYVPEDSAALSKSAVDWRTTGAVTQVKDQGICGSCWSFGAAEAIEGQYFRKTNLSVPLSQQSLMDCSWGYGNNACDGGEAFRAYEWILHSGFIPTTGDYGTYLMADGKCHAEKSADPIAISGYVNITSGDMNAMLGNITEYGPVAVAIDASLKSFNFYSSGVYYDPQCGNTPADLDHAVLAVGFNTSSTGEDYWIVKNSWSTHYGDDGYIYMSRKNNNCGVATDAHRPILA